MASRHVNSVHSLECSSPQIDLAISSREVREEVTSVRGISAKNTLYQNTWTIDEEWNRRVIEFVRKVASRRASLYNGRGSSLPLLGLEVDFWFSL